MPRGIASGTISFGLVSVPVKLYTATQSKSVSFRMLHAKDRARVRQQYVCTGCEEVVERDDMLRGYEYAKGQYAVLSDDELKALEQRSDQTIEIEEFVPLSSVDPIYFDSAHYLGPDKGAARAFRLLCEAMARTGRAAVARYSTRGRQQLVLLRSTGAALLLHGLHYADEVRDAGEIDYGEAAPAKPAELDLAVKLVGELAAEAFDPAKYSDEHRQATLALIEKKVEGKEIVVAEAPERKAQVIDLMEALRASLGESRRKPAASTRRPPAQAVPVRGESAGEPASAARSAARRKPPARMPGDREGASPGARRERAK
jgi:DNA end-binding protein Ku